eukprot:TRINITY_DN4976_c0_g1_i1.p1 TRINITY_DN4976_c0_g1~~TRINITY_DN4976_c0_g1_i1.p1  ORF type:complete len:186 (+),score=50.05 TRINITY_DN4976_c0_g1_i1:1328-1885(+)
MKRWEDSRSNSYRRASNGQGEVRRSSNTGRDTAATRAVNTRDGSSCRGRGHSKLESGAEQRMLSRPALDADSGDETEVYMENSGWVKRSEVVKTASQSDKIEVILDPDNTQEMTSIVWDFSKSGARVKALGKACPQAAKALRAGDELFSINGQRVLGEPRSSIEEKWHKAQRYDDDVKLLFMPKA